MATPNRIVVLLAFGFMALAGVSELAVVNHAEGRAGGGGSGGSRGSRSFQAPSRQAQPSPSQPSREATPPPQQPAPMAPQPGGFMRGIGTAIIGGFLGSMLFSGLANAGIGGLGGSGFGMIEILLLAGLGYFLYRKFGSPAVATGYSPMQYQSAQDYASPYPPVQEAPAVTNAIDYRSLMLMDRSFDADLFLKTAQDNFFKVQGAWNKQDTATLNALCGSELMKTWKQELDALHSRGQHNKMENIALRRSQITEAWTENGEDYITVRLLANLLDYTVDAKSGALVNGSNAEPVEFEEYWTFARPVGPNPWKLSAVQQP